MGFRKHLSVLTVFVKGEQDISLQIVMGLYTISVQDVERCFIMGG